MDAKLKQELFDYFDENHAVLLMEDDFNSLEEIIKSYASQQMPSLPKWEAINHDPEGIAEDDDFIARINGYVLRVEQMDYCNWWYSVGIGTVELCNKTGAYDAEEAKRFATGIYLEDYLKSLQQEKETFQDDVHLENREDGK